MSVLDKIGEGVRGVLPKNRELPYYTLLIYTPHYTPLLHIPGNSIKKVQLVFVSGCLSVCLPSCLPNCLPACPPAYWPACLAISARAHACICL